MAAFKPNYINKIKTPVGVVAFPHLEKPDSTGQYADDKYKVRLLFDKDTDLTPFKKAVLKCARENDAWPDDIKLSQIDTPFRDGDDKPELDGHAGTVFINSKTKKRPLILDVRRDDLDPAEIYPGCKARLVVSLMSYEATEVVKDPETGKKKREITRGVTTLLEIVQKVGDGPRLSGGGGADRSILDDGEIDEELDDEDPRFSDDDPDDDDLDEDDL